MMLLNFCKKNTKVQFVDRDSQQFRLQVDGKPAAFEIVEIREFTPVSKMMSILFRQGDQQVCYCKGADTAIIPRLRPQDQEKAAADVTMLARKGLRTLVLAKGTDLDGTLEYLGVAGSEDMLAEGVPDSLALLK